MTLPDLRLEVHQIVNAIDTQDSYGIQNRCIVELSYATAIRINELIQLNTTDIGLYNCQVIIKHGKGRKQRILPLIHSAVFWLKKYLKTARLQLLKKENCSALFIGKAGARVSASYIDRLMKQLREKQISQASRSMHCGTVAQHIYYSKD